MNLDSIKTIEDDDDVPHFSEDSNDEEEFQPTKHKIKNSKDFDSHFDFSSMSTFDSYNRDVWNDMAKYVKRKAKRKTDDKIATLKSKKRLAAAEESKNAEDAEAGEDSENEDSDGDASLSEEDMKVDNIKIKDKRKGKKAKENFQFSDEISGNTEIDSFYQMNLSRPLMKAISAMNFSHPTPIQSATIPIALLGRDVCGCAATGTGKTAAYMLPILERLLYRPQTEMSVTRVLVLVPTRELGVQVYQVARQLAQFTSVEFGLSVGGLDLKIQEANLRKRPDIVIATPGRLIDHIKNTIGFALDTIEVLVLDEADRMLDEYFAEQMKEIVKQCAESRQTLLFSATMTTAVEDLARVSLTNPVKIFVDSNQNVAFNLRQEFIRVRKEAEGTREAILAALVCRTFRSHCIIFVKTKSEAHRLHILLGLLDVRVGELHGNLSQPQRLDSLKRFRDGEVDVLIATDVAARGLDIPGIRSVINYVLPDTLEHYIHRVGRTARAGRSGVSVSLAGEGERRLVKEIVKNARQPVKARLIAPDILDKYQKKVADLQGDLKKILREELEERMLAKSEHQLKKAERILNPTGDGQERSWFQSKQERKNETAKLKSNREDQMNGKKGSKRANEEKDKDKNQKSKNKKKKEVDPEEVEKVWKKAKLMKKSLKPSKIRTVNDDFKGGKTKNGKVDAKKTKRSFFHKDLTNTSRKSVKNLRHESNKKSKKRK